MSNPVVTCEVSTCNHWLPDNHCGAGNIDILNEEEGKMSRISEQTECKTFNKKSGLANMIGALDNVNWGGITSGLFQEGTQMTPSVTCVVDSCKYWDDGNLCGADEISVTGNEATECQGTNCQTFEKI
jgi:hypothetical protein